MPLIRSVRAQVVIGWLQLNPDIVFLNGADADEPIVELADIRRQCEAKGIPLEIGRDFHDKHDFPLRTATSIQSMLDAEAELSATY